MKLVTRLCEVSLILLDGSTPLLMSMDTLSLYMLPKSTFIWHVTTQSLKKPPLVKLLSKEEGRFPNIPKSAGAE